MSLGLSHRAEQVMHPGWVTEQLLASAVGRHAAGLADASDLLAHVDPAMLLDDYGMPDLAKITIAAADLAARRCMSDVNFPWASPGFVEVC